MVFSHRILGRLADWARWHGLVAAVVGAAAVCGCGQKGPLFLPVPPQLPPPQATSPIVPPTTNPTVVPVLPAEPPASAAR